MKDKRTQIIDAAIKLFAEKGYHSTSIQEITDAAGISKGSMYLYFKSKDDLLLTIYNWYFERMFKEIADAVKEDLTPKEKLTVQVMVQLEKFVEYRDFIKMQMREQYIHQNEEIRETVHRSKMEAFAWLHERILEWFGEGFRPWAVDCAHLFQGMISSYMGFMMMHNKAFNLQELAPFLVGRLEDMANGFMRDKLDPVLKQEDMGEFSGLFRRDRNDPLERSKEQLQLMKEALETLALEGDLGEDLHASLQVLEEELRKPEPKRVIVTGMLTVLQQAGRPELKKPLKQLQAAVTAVLERS